MADSPYQTAARLLTIAAQVLTDAGRDVPAGRFVAPGEPVFTQPVLCARVLQSMPGQIARPDLTVPWHCLQMRTLDVEIWLTRCVPTINDAGQPPPPAAQNAAAELMFDDAVALTSGLQAKAGVDGGVGMAMTVGQWRPYGPNGGLAGVIQTVSVQIG